MQRTQPGTTPLLDLPGELADEFLTTRGEVGGGRLMLCVEETAYGRTGGARQVAASLLRSCRRGRRQPVIHAERVRVSRVVHVFEAIFPKRATTGG